MRFILFIVIIFISTGIIGQKTTTNEYASIDKKALQLPDSLTSSTKDIAAYINSNFKTDREKVRAIFIWIATNIHYDIDNMFAINFYESAEEKIIKPLKTRKGICENYAALFNDICLKSGIKCYQVEGYTKQNGFTDYIPHAWCAAFIDGAWFLFDPTWGSGYIYRGKFFSKINTAYFKAEPSVLIKSHMPFDYLWQFLNYPVTTQEFYEGKTVQNTSKPYFNFIDSIKVYEQLSNPEQLTATARRIESNGVKNSMIFDRLQHIKVEIENDRITKENERQQKIVNLYNAAASDYNHSLTNFNAFIEYFNRQFKPEKTDTDIQGMIDLVNKNIDSAKLKLSQIDNPDENVMHLKNELSKSIADVVMHVKEEQDWLKEYFSKSKSKRRSMFYEKKITWFGIPIN